MPTLLQIIKIRKLHFERIQLSNITDGLGWGSESRGSAGSQFYRDASSSSDDSI